MLDALRQFLNELGDGGKDAARFDENDYRLAVAALLVHVVSADGKTEPREMAKLNSILKTQYALDDAAAARLVDAATAADREAVDLYRFTRTLIRALDEPARLRVVEMMWQVVYADGRRTELEDNIVWRVADLLGISTRDRVDLRHRVEAERKAHAQAG
jgi:uncharacterized tellurite resistance protein B-like protein